MSTIGIMRAIRVELGKTGEDITIDHSSTQSYEESSKRFKEFRMLVKRISELARKPSNG